MNNERWQQINDLYAAALERDTPVRGLFLKEACAGDEALRGEVESLLASNDAVGAFLSSSALETAAKSLAMEADRVMIGRRVGPYEIQSLIGAGGMGQIYLAKDPRLDRSVALKLLPRELTQDVDRVRRFRQEARAASALNHPNILTIFEIGEHEGIHFIATEYIDGQTLRQRLAASPVKLAEILDMVIQAAGALSAAHDAGILHRDIKPENIMVRRDGYVKVLDFGIAKLMGLRIEQRVSVPPITDPGTLMGTAHYVSPDQLLGLELDGRSDIFSLGVVLYELITGRTPFEGATTGAVLAAILNEEPLPLARFSRVLPAELDRIVEKALQKDRDRRYQGIRDFLLDLRNLKLELEVETRLKRARQDSITTGSTGDTGKRQLIQPSRAAYGDLHQNKNHCDGSTTEITADTGERQSNAPPRVPRGESGCADLACSDLEPVGGAVPLDSPFYIERAVDREFHEAIERQDSLVLVKGARQVGKTSLLARGLQRARQRGARVVMIDFQSLSQEFFASAEKLILSLAETLADQLDLDASPSRMWNSLMSPGINFERFLRREVLSQMDSPVVWGLDEVDRLFTCDFGSDIFGLFRSWHNKRALDPEGPWKRLTQVIAYATEAHLFITDLNQSPFNVGTRLALEDFTYEQVAQLNERYGTPLRDRAEIARYFRLVGGHPYLVRRGLHEMAQRRWTLARLESEADHDEGPFGDHLRRMLLSLSQDPALLEVVQSVLEGRPSSNTENFYRLRSAGLLAGDSVRDLRPRCQLYATYLEKHLL